MTLVEASKLLDEWANVPLDSVNVPTEYLRRAKASIDTHLAGMGEPVAYLHSVVVGDGEPDQALSFAPDNFSPVGVVGYRLLGHVPLYTAPPIDIAAVREVIAALRSIGNDHHDAWADKLTAALPKET